MDPDKLAALGLQTIRGQQPGADSSYIAQLEEIRGRALPEGYIQLLKAFGPSLFRENVGVRALQPSPWAVEGIEVIEAFEGQSSEFGFDVLRQSERLFQSDDDFPDETLVIGTDACGNRFLLAADDAVWFFDHDTGRRYLCAEDFDSFLAALQLCKGAPSADR